MKDAACMLEIVVDAMGIVRGGEDVRSYFSKQGWEGSGGLLARICTGCWNQVGDAGRMSFMQDCCQGLAQLAGYFRPFKRRSIKSLLCCKMAFLSDLHTSWYEWDERIASVIASIAPELVFVSDLEQLVADWWVGKCLGLVYALIGEAGKHHIGCMPWLELE